MYMSKMGKIINLLETFRNFKDISDLDSNFLNSLIPSCKAAPIFLTEFKGGRNGFSGKGTVGVCDKIWHYLEETSFPYDTFFLENTSPDCSDIHYLDTGVPIGCYITKTTDTDSVNNYAFFGFGIKADGAIVHDACVTVIADGDMYHNNINYINGQLSGETRINTSLYYVKQMKLFLDVLNCNNVGTRKTTQKNRINKKRRRINKYPFYSYHELVITGSSKISGAVIGGTHASPRLHTRRGHIRRLRSGKNTYVSQCLVGNKDLGAVGKQYVVKSC